VGARVLVSLMEVNVKSDTERKARRRNEKLRRHALAMARKAETGNKDKPRGYIKEVATGGLTWKYSPDDNEFYSEFDETDVFRVHGLTEMEEQTRGRVLRELVDTKSHAASAKRERQLEANRDHAISAFLVKLKQTAPATVSRVLSRRQTMQTITGSAGGSPSKEGDPSITASRTVDSGDSEPLGILPNPLEEDQMPRMQQPKPRCHSAGVSGFVSRLQTRVQTESVNDRLQRVRLSRERGHRRGEEQVDEQLKARGEVRARDLADQQRGRQATLSKLLGVVLARRFSVVVRQLAQALNRLSTGHRAGQLRELRAIRMIQTWWRQQRLQLLFRRNPGVFLSVDSPFKVKTSPYLCTIYCLTIFLFPL
jgi:hypothetical protein